MKCPHCEYEDEITGTAHGFLQGDKGDFFVGPAMTRQSAFYPSMKDSSKLYGCPSCGKTFIGHIFY